MTGSLVQLIMLLSSKELAIELFDAYAPSLNARALNLSRGTKKRSEDLFVKLDQFVDENPNEHSALFRVLNTIAAVNGDNTNSKLILDFLEYNPALNVVYQSLEYARKFGNQATLANLAAFVAVRAKMGEGQEQSDAKSLWSQLQVNASKVQQGNYLHKNITEPTHDEAQMQRGLTTFREELERYIRRVNQQKDYIALVIPSRTTEGYIRYYVNTSPPPRDVLQAHDGKPYIGRDTNMTGFEIRHYYARDMVWISETKSGRQDAILELFLHHVLGSEVERRHRAHCEHRLPTFKTPQTFHEEIYMTEEERAKGENVWISEMEIRVADDLASNDWRLKSGDEIEYTPTVFRGTELSSVHDQISKQLKTEFDPKDWEVLSVTLKARLHPYIYDNDYQPIGESSDYAIVTFPVKPGGCTPRAENKYKNDPNLRRKFLELRRRWDLEGRVNPCVKDGNGAA